MAVRRTRTLAPPFVIVVSGFVGACAQARVPAAAAPPTPPPTHSVAAPAASSVTSPGLASPSVDRDGDRIADDADRCPDEPETSNGRDDEDGCPDHVVVMTTSNPPPVQVVRFEGHAIAPTLSSGPILDAVADILQQRPDITRLVIEGHEDPSSPADQALRLSKARAERIRDELVARGVAGERLQPIGLGAYCPVAIAKAIEDRNKNRRVSFVIEEHRDGPTYAQVGCEAAREANLLP